MIATSVRFAALVLCATTATAVQSEGSVSENREPRIALAAFRLDRTEVRPQEMFYVTLSFLNIGEKLTSGAPLMVQIQLQAVEKSGRLGKLVSSREYWPSCPSPFWHPGTPISQCWRRSIPENSEEGEYRLLVALYDPRSRKRVALANSDLPVDNGRSEIARVRLTKAPAPPQPMLVTLVDPPSRPPVRETLPAVEIANQSVQVGLDASAPVLRWIRDRQTGEEFLGSPHVIPPELTVCDKQNGWEYLSSFDPRVTTRWSLQRQPDSAVYHGWVEVDRKAALSLDVTVRLEADGVKIGFAEVRESEGFDLVDVFFREMVALSESRGGTLVIPAGMGRKIVAQEVEPSECEFQLGWFHTFCLGAVCPNAGRTLALLRPQGLEDRMFAWISSDGRNGKSAVLGTRFIHRLKAGPPAAQFVAQNATGAKITLVRSGDVQTPAHWTDAARFIRRPYQGKPNPLYVRSLTYKIECHHGNWPTRHRLCTFPECLEVIRNLSVLTDGMPQIAYLVGWQHNGHDTGYPDARVVNPHLGGLEALLRLKAEAKKWGAEVSFHDCYDDAYQDSPAWDPAVIAVDPQGHLKKGGVHAGGQSYIIAMPKYLEQAIQRARYVVNHYGIEQSYHIDVFAAAPIRHDHDPKSPSDALQSVKAKLAIIREFNRMGVDVTSECLSEPFIGPVTWVRLLGAKKDCIPGEKPIPFVPFIVHGHVIYQGGGGGYADYDDVKGSLLIGQTSVTSFTNRTPEDEMLDRIFLGDLPLRPLASREMQTYACDEARGIERIGYGPDTCVEVDWKNDRYRVVDTGREIARDYKTFVETKPGVVLAYSRDGGRIDFQLPASLRDAAPLEVLELTVAEPGQAIPFHVEKDLISFDAKPHRPYKVYCKSSLPKTPTTRAGGESVPAP